MKDWKAKMKISEEKDSARVVSGRLQRQISQECGLVETSDLEHRSLSYWVKPLRGYSETPASQERGIRKVNLIPKEAIAGERGCECNEGGKILSAGE